MLDGLRDGNWFTENKKIIKDQSVRKYLENKKILNNKYLEERSGDIQTYQDQTKLFDPLIKSQQGTLKATQDKIVSSQDLTSNAFVPFIT